MNIIARTIEHTEQRYPTCGDWWFDESGDLQVRVSKMGNVWYETLVMLHEMIEALLCKRRGIPEEKVSRFDRAFEEDRVRYQWGDAAEPGDDRNAPYRKEHFFATTVERLLARELGVDWRDYEEDVENL